MENKVLKVKMLGGFTLEYGGEVLTIERNSVTKVNQLLQAILYFSEGVARSQLMEYMFGNDKVVNPSNSLRAIVFRLRKSLSEAGLPEDDYVHISHGTYSWTDRIEYECDAHQFIKIGLEAQAASTEAKKMQLLQQAINIYEGDFLSELKDVEWVNTEAGKLRQQYEEGCKLLCDYYKENKQYDRLKTVAEKAARLYPFGEWQIYEMQALTELGLADEAIALYESTEKLLFREMGIGVFAKMTELLDSLGSEVKNAPVGIAKVQENLEKNKSEEEGAFFCSYPVFAESYRYIRRVISRSGQPAWLVLCTITDGKGQPLKDSERLETLSRELGEAIRVSIRSGDMYSKYSDNQYLMLLLGLSSEGCKLVQSRVNSNMEKDSRRRYLKYNYTPVSEYSQGKIETLVDEMVDGGEQ